MALDQESNQYTITDRMSMPVFPLNTQKQYYDHQQGVDPADDGIVIEEQRRQQNAYPGEKSERCFPKPQSSSKSHDNETDITEIIE